MFKPQLFFYFCSITNKMITMKLKDIMAISGYPGLYKFVSQGRNGIIVESMTDGKRNQVPSTAKVSALSDIAIYTSEGEKPLAEILELIRLKENDQQSISHKASTEELKTYFEGIVPNYDAERVYPSDIKKVISWYNQLQGVGILNFLEEEPKPADAEGEAKTESTDSSETPTIEAKKALTKEKKTPAKVKTNVGAKGSTAKEPAAKMRIHQKKT